MESDSRTGNDDARRERLRALAAQHKVRFRVLRTRVQCERRRRMVGYDVSLTGQHAAQPPATPDCRRCQSIWVDLGILAHAALPRPSWTTRFSVRPFDHGVHFGPTGAPWEVELVIEVRYRSDDADAVDDCEDECLTRLLANLHALGVAER